MSEEPAGRPESGNGAVSFGRPSRSPYRGGLPSWLGWFRGVDFFLDDLVVALGSECIHIASREHPEPASYPAYVARGTGNRQIVALGTKARDLLGREPQAVEVVPLLRHGVPDHPRMFAEFLQRIVSQHFRSARMARPRILCAGNFQSPLLKEVCIEGLIRVRSRDIMFCEPEIAAAVGMGLDILEPDLRSVLVFERDWTGFMVMSMGGSLTRLRLPIGCDDLLDDIRIFLEESNKVAPREDELLEHFRRVGFTGACSLTGWEAWVDQVERGRPVRLELDGTQFQRAVVPTLLRLKHAINRSLQSLSREQRHMVQGAPLHLSGEYAGLPGFRQLMQEVIGREIRQSSHPAHDMAIGLVRLIPEIDLLRSINGGGEVRETAL